MKIAFSAIETKDDVITAVSKVLRIAKERISVLTIQENLVSYSSDFVGTVMNTRQYVFDVVVGPNPLDDSVAALEQLQ